MELEYVDLVVIGGGPAGMMCAYTAAERGLSVVLLEPNDKLGKKLRITGKGRCNVNNNCDIKTFMANIPGDGRFLYSALNRLSPADTIVFFESRGLPLKTERGNRVFPQSDNANDVANLMASLCKKAGVRIRRTSAKQIITENGAVAGVATGEGYLPCRAAAVCTGGLSYPLTGSTGAGYEFARNLGHTVTPLRPSLVPLVSPDAYCAEMQGFAPRNVTLSAYEDDKLIYRELGEMLFTHFGVSGPLALSASAKMRKMGSAAYRLSIDLKPGLDEKKLDARILRDFEKYANREFKNALGDLAGHSMIPILVRLSGIPEDKPVNSITREERKRLVSLLKAF
ncbi:MAG: aminoacetone oxidase family FAD-binding enzyme, partial [Clostridia bacterium]|nr:aminoacetone oxidase family FAD-binding enzyme [Clostridia bacterium]